MPDPNEPVAEGSQHWFAGRDVEVLIYRINRRPLMSGTLSEDAFAEAQPGDVLLHVAANLLEHDATAETGRRHKRTWQIGNVVVDRDRRILTARIGWRRSGEALSSVWDSATRVWIDRVVPGEISGVAPLAFDANQRVLGVMRHSSFSEQNVAKVIAEVLNKAEQDRERPTTNWDVEPIGDREGFYEWLEETDQVARVDFVFKRPNPDAERAFEDLFHRLDEHRAESIKETIIAADPEVGLNKEAFWTEPTTLGFIAGAMRAFGYVVGRGFKDGRASKYDQRRRVAREQLYDVGPSWDDATEEVARVTQRARRERLR